MAKHEPKYEPLGRHLSAASHAVVMTFDEISRLVGGLPPSAYRYPAWWANEVGGRHVQAHAWLDHGRRVVAVDLDRQVVRFSSGQNGEAPETDSTTQDPRLPETRSIEPYPSSSPMEGQVVSEETQTAWPCPKDGTAMQPMGRRGRGGAWRCPTCRGVFIDVEAMRRGRGAQPPKWSPAVTSVLMSLLATFVVRRLRRRSRKPPSPPPG